MELISNILNYVHITDCVKVNSLESKDGHSVWFIFMQTICVISGVRTRITVIAERIENDGISRIFVIILCVVASVRGNAICNAKIIRLIALCILV